MKILTNQFMAKSNNEYKLYSLLIYSHSKVKVVVKIKRWFLCIPYWSYLKEKPTGDNWSGVVMEFNNYTHAFQYINEIEAVNIG